MKNILKNMLFATVIVILCFLVIETSWRIRMACVNKNPKLLFYGIEFLELKTKSIVSKVDNLIYKDQSDIEHSQETNIIWTFGGSTTRGYYVKKKNSWPIKMEYYLNRNLNKPVAVVNKAELGSVCKDYIDKFQTSILTDEKLPNLVIFYMGINDASVMLTYPKQSQKYKKIKTPFFTTLNCRLMSTSLFYVSLKEKYFQIFKKNINEAWKFQVSDTPNIPEMSYFKNNLNRIIDLSEDFDFKLIICCVPISHSYLNKHTKLKNVYENIVSTMKDVTQKRKINFINLNKEIFEKYKNFEQYYLDGVHINEEGHDLIAQFLASYIEKDNLL